jgi:hypothetical protein
MQTKRLPEISTILVGVVVAMVLLAAKPQSAPTPATPSTIQNAQSSNEQILRAQLESARYYGQQMLATIHWSLSGVFLLVILVGGINWISNYRLYERERDALKQEMATAFRTEFEKLSQALRQEFQSLALEDKSRISEIRQDLAKEAGSFESKLQSVRKSVTEDAAKRADDVRKEMLRFRYDFLSFQAEELEGKKRGYSAIQIWVEFLELLVELGWETHAEFAYKGIQKAIAMGGTISYSNYDKLSSLLKQAQRFPKAPSDLLPSLEKVRN